MTSFKYRSLTGGAAIWVDGIALPLPGTLCDLWGPWKFMNGQSLLFSRMWAGGRGLAVEIRRSEDVCMALFHV
jgi:hypothetical protein